MLSRDFGVIIFASKTQNNAESIEVEQNNLSKKNLVNFTTWNHKANHQLLITMRKKIIEQRLFVRYPFNQKCHYSSAFASEVAGGASITKMVFTTRTWIDEF